MSYKIEFGPKNARKVKIGLKTNEVMSAYDGLLAAGELAIVIFSPDGEKVESHVLRLAVGGNR